MGYYEHKFKLSFALDQISENGLPVDRERQDRLREYIDKENERLWNEVQMQVPEAVLPANRKTGYKSLPKDLRAALKERDLLVKGEKLDYYITNHYDICNSLSYYWKDLSTEEDPFAAGLVKILPFNPNSKDQLLGYIRYMGYRIPLHIETLKPTTGKEELEKLIAETDDDVLKLCQKVKKLTKLKGTYVSGAWVPGDDGYVHGTFRFGTASQQTSCTDPNIQQFPEHFDPDDEWISDLMHMVKGCVRAKAGHKLVKVDARGAHARMQGFLAEDANYYRLAAFDVHSYNTAYYVDLPDKHDLLALSDGDLKARLKEIKKAHAHDRNFKLKRVAYLMQFGGGAEKAFRILSAGFHSLLEVQAMMDMIAGLFPKTFRQFPKHVRSLVSRSPRIISPYGCCRYFWSRDMEEATAFLPSNCFHCHVQSALVRLHERGALRRYNACNFPHDAVWYHCPDHLVRECIDVTREEMEKPSDILVNSLGPFWCSADAQVGESLIEMEDV